jgi:pyruvate dehydrogenase (quinone)
MLGKGDSKERHLLADTARQVLSSVLPGDRT